MEWMYRNNNRRPEFDDLLKLVNGRYASNQFLQFITGIELPESEAQMMRIARMTNAMLNNNGGVIIIGITEVRKRAGKILGLPKKAIDINILHQLIISHNSPFVEGIEIFSIDVSTERECFFIRVPSGAGGFMFSDHRFYSMRTGRVDKLDESGVANLYHKQSKKQLEIYSIYNTQGIPEMFNGKFRAMSFYPKVLIRNTGQAVEDTYKMEIYLPASLYQKSTNLANHFSRHEGKYVVFSYPGRDSIFGNEILKMLEFRFRVSYNNAQQFESSDLLLKLYYSQGMHNQSLSLKEIFTYNGQLISKSDFMTES